MKPEDFDSYEDFEEYVSRINEVREDLSVLLEAEGVDATFDPLSPDIIVHGSLTALMEFCQNYRSEIEELQ